MVASTNARVSKRLSALRVKAISEPGLYADGDGLYLQAVRVASTGTLSKIWVFRWNHGPRGARRERRMSLGPVRDVPLEMAREQARQARLELRAGVDPLDKRAELKAQQLAASAAEMSFDDCAERYIAAYEKGWKSPKHRQQWENTLKTYASPVFGKMPVRIVNTALVLKVVEPIWTEKTETAERLLGRIERVLDWAAGRGYREGDNPARWSGHLEYQLPQIPKRKRTEHHPALPYAEVGAFCADLKTQVGLAAQALEFTILTACRTSEAIGARWTEFDLEDKVWTVPAERMKAGREHRVPLSARAVELLASLTGLDATFVFAGRKENTSMSNMAMLKLLERMGRNDLTVHC